jgi:hypothetical protein
MQNPSNIGIGVMSLTGAVTAWGVEHSFDWSTVMSDLWNGATDVTWFQNGGLDSSVASLPAHRQLCLSVRGDQAERYQRQCGGHNGYEPNPGGSVPMNGLSGGSVSACAPARARRD